MCVRRGLKSAYTSTQSDQSLRYPHEETFFLASLAIPNPPSEDSDHTAQTDLNLNLALMSDGTFSDVTAH